MSDEEKPSGSSLYRGPSGDKRDKRERNRDGDQPRGVLNQDGGAGHDSPWSSLSWIRAFNWAALFACQVLD